MKKLMSYGNYCKRLHEKANEFNQKKEKIKVLKSLAKFVEYDKKIGKAISSLHEIKKKSLVKRMYLSWRNTFSLIHVRYLMFCTMAIKIKNAVMVFSIKYKCL